MVTAWSTDVPYVVNAVTFLLSAALVSRISETKLRSDDSLRRGYWRDVADGLRLVVTGRPLRTVLVVWNVALVGSAAVNVAEVVFAKDTLDAATSGSARSSPRAESASPSEASSAPRRSGASASGGTTSARWCSWGSGGAPQR